MDRTAEAALRIEAAGDRGQAAEDRAQATDDSSLTSALDADIWASKDAAIRGVLNGDADKRTGKNEIEKILAACSSGDDGQASPGDRKP